MSQKILSFEAARVDTTLYVKDPKGQYVVASDEMIYMATRVAIERKYPQRTVINEPEIAADYFKNKLNGFEHEVFSIIFLDSQNKLIAYREMFNGTLTCASVYPREVVKAAISYNAAAVILAHNHPSGQPEPSKADEEITKCLKEALDLIDVRVLDHIIVGGNTTKSMAAMGLI
ncbi:hypothetical protein Nstercoris_02285 (plasmid) [Nitrosomonas stercoris]|uniref:MPN domain-containing protein n=1 Tax=Nitrosomonas stercoris TaxID=1444684 RepID=A0A4Y1YPA9_9PROT|nr:hypothetical protein Nstercoris_02285 [Nitrosomonas stercoris]